MAIVLPRGLLNNISADYIRRFMIDEARILAVVGLHVNTFKPHTGTKTSVLFLHKYTDEEKQKIQEIKGKNEGEWDDSIEELKEKYQDVGWDKSVDEEDLPEELKSFIETHFEVPEELEEEQTEEVAVEESDEIREEAKEPLKIIVDEIQELQTVLEEKQEQLNNAPNERKRELRKQVRTLNNKLKKLHKEISQRTLGGQISLVLHQDRLIEQFKKFWLDGKVINEMDYLIFFAVNQKPLKNNRGEYRYERRANGEPLLDKHEHPIIDHDLDEIAEAFVKFAKEQDFDFWRD